MARDPIHEGLARWKTVDAAVLDRDLDLECDVVVIGTGAGGAITADALAQAGLDIVLVEEGPLAGSTQFRMLEREAYPLLYQEGAARQTLDKAITILQGRCVGGSTTVNWTSSFRTPRRTLAHWRDVQGLRSMDEAGLAPWFERIEERLGIAPWAMAPNENNDALRRGCQKLGIASGVIARNVRGCANLGYCGTGCPINAKQSMLVTAIPAVLDRGARLIYRARVEKLALDGERVTACQARGIAGNGVLASGHRVRVHARHYVLAAGAIGSPAVLLRSGAPDPYQTLGRRTFIHPTVVSAGLMRERVDGWYGAPQSVYSDHFVDTAPFDGPAGFKLESAPAYPLLVGSTLPGFGEAHAQWMRKMPWVQVTIALLRDGFHPQSPGGRVLLRSDGSPVLDYVMTAYLWEAVRRAFLTMAEIQFAAGAQSVMPMHETARAWSSWREARAAIADLEMKPLAARVVTAHLMGGCAMGRDAQLSVVDESGRHHQLANLSVHDGSLFPTSLAANPQLSIYAIAAKLSASLAKSFVAA
jgi:choline dehydrogenase-like flavoprotein